MEDQDLFIVARFSALLGTSSIDPSIAVSRSPRQKHPGICAVAIGPATRPNNSRTGSTPSRTRALVIDPAAAIVNAWDQVIVASDDEEDPSMGWLDQAE